MQPKLSFSGSGQACKQLFALNSWPEAIAIDCWQWFALKP
jgi:hypothetical protein